MKAEEYKGLSEFVLETTHGVYSDYGWGFASDFGSFDDACAKCDFWNESGGSYRVVRKGEVVYPT